MSNAEITRYITEIDKIHRTGKATEHSYRPALKTLFEKITTGLTIINEPKQIECGAPDYIITKGMIPLGYIEAKSIQNGLHNKNDISQFERYKQSLGNLIITDYITFQLFVEGNHHTTVTIAKETKGSISPDKNKFDDFLELIKTFTDYSGKTITKSVDLANMMAVKARLLSEIITTTLSKNKTGSLAEQYEAFKKVLIHNLGELSFADMYAQTLAYGLFTARLNQKDDQTFTRVIAAHFMPKSNPFLRKFFMHIAFDLDNRISWVVDALTDIYNSVSVDDILKEFGKSNQDPFIHFYETFLAKYDPALRESRGVYYTPLPVVKFIVKAVDDILQKEFSLSDGLADNSKIKVPIIEKDKQGNSKVTGHREYHKVQILDPATGTGTFLSEVIEVIHSHFANQKGLWKSYCKNHLIPRLNGFEFLMASYAMAHFKLDMTLRKTGFNWNYDEEENKNRLNVYLTNTLEEPENEASKLAFINWLTEEASEANNIKKNTPVMIILGNPPYSGESANKTSEDFLEAYKKEPGGIEKLKERNPKWINDDYVKFIRYGQNFIEKYNGGVLAFINNHGFLENPTFRGMRWNLLKTYDTIYIIDLHGNTKKKEVCPDGSKDENIFDIMQGVSINIFIKTGKKKNGTLATVYHSDNFGLREIKYSYLSKNTIKSVKWKKIEPVEPFYFFTQKDFSKIDEYNEGFGVQELLKINSVGVATGKDDVFVNENQNQLIDNINEHFKIKTDNNLIKTIDYRPFDNRYIYFATDKIERARTKVMRHFIVGNNMGLVIGRQGQAVGSMQWNLIFVTKKIIDLNLYYRGGGTVFPLYIYPFDDNTERQPNLNMEIIKLLETKLKLQFVSEKTDDKKIFAPIDILDYIYAVLHSPSYREKYKEFLKIDFPRVPYPIDVKQFRKLAELGALLRSAHLLENVMLSKNMALYPVEGDNTIDIIKYENENVWINKKQYFSKVPVTAWQFYIGGYQPAQKWLKDRKGRTLNFDEIQHYQKIVNVLCLTGDLQGKIAGVMDG
ncbi:MAG: N-6 DNA methylase [Treponema sp.]|nr:N-6 DNA methylase [Treponema sp.]